MCAYRKTECKISKLTGHELFLIGGNRVLPPYKRSRGLQYGNGIHGFRHASDRTMQRQCGHQPHHPVRNLPEEKREVAAYISKALSFVRKMQKILAAPQVPPLIPIRTSSDNTTENPASPLQWTGNAIDLVELIYGINEMGCINNGNMPLKQLKSRITCLTFRCINNGNMPLKQLAPLLYKIFGVESKDCYRFYIDIKRRKNESRTYFLNRMQEKLNERMLRDEEMERMRR